MELSPGERVTLTLDTGERVTGEIRDPHHPNLNYPDRIGNGQVKVGLELDREEGAERFYGPTVSVTAFHGDKNPKRRDERTVVESYRTMYGDMYDKSDRVVVVGLDRESRG